jgi:hypothetical protein
MLIYISLILSIIYYREYQSYHSFPKPGEGNADTNKSYWCHQSPLPGPPNQVCGSVDINTAD